MKILFLNAGNAPDYQCDVIFHGLKMLFGTDVYQNSENRYMFDDMPENEKMRLYGKGFTMYGLLPAKQKRLLTEHEIKKYIKDCHFDYIIYGSIRRYSMYFKLVRKYYSKEKIILVDGEDHSKIERWYVGKGVYFKRELNGKHPNVVPVCFGIPKSKVVEKIDDKTKIQAYIVPDDRSTYIYSKEIDYYNDYKTSWFGVTKKKAGWDCLRHYEIMANGCIPYFIGLADCPEETMCLFPKRMVLETNNLFDKQDFDTSKLESYAVKILQWTHQNLTTEKIARYVIDMSEKIEFSKINDNIVVKLIINIRYYIRKIKRSCFQK